MKKRFIKITGVLYGIAALVFCLGWMWIGKDGGVRDERVMLNEITHEITLDVAQRNKLEEIIADGNNQAMYRKVNEVYLAVGILLFAGVGICLIWFYRTSVRPFIRMEEFAAQLAKGNLDFPLEIERSQMFGEFTWSFDTMRTELKEARRKEKDAVEKNRTMIAEISHDIKTPVSTIRNYSEGLALMPDMAPERKQRYIEVILKKCDEVGALTDDLFLHALNDMDRLEVNAQPVDVGELWDRISMELARQGVSTGACPVAGKVLVDERRLGQVLENVLGNAEKYGRGAEVSVSVEDGERLYIKIQDEGSGIPDADILYAKQKFYRGSNALERQGAGLGLYISDILMKQMGGELTLENRGGLLVTLCLLKVI